MLVWRPHSGALSQIWGVPPRGLPGQLAETAHGGPTARGGEGACEQGTPRIKDDSVSHSY